MLAISPRSEEGHARALRSGKQGDQAILGAVCEVGARLAERLGLGSGVRDGLSQSFERWDGKGAPRALATDDICLPARLTEVGHQVVIFDWLGGPESAVAVVRRRAGGWFDPVLAETFGRCGTDILDEIGSRDVWEAVLEAEPAPRTIGPEGLDGLARAFADMVDLKSPFLLGHSSGVAALSERAAVALGFVPEAVADLRRAALLHDLGRVAVSNGIWEKQAASAPPTGSGSGSIPTRPSGSWPAPGSWSRWPGRPGCTTSGRTALGTTGAPQAPRCPLRPGCLPPRMPPRP
jgi:hypothetical protein